MSEQREHPVRRSARWIRERQWFVLLGLFLVTSGTYVACANTGEEAFDNSPSANIETVDSGDHPSSNSGDGSTVR